MSRAAFLKAERTRAQRRPATPAQRHRILQLASEQGIEAPRVFWSQDASKVIRLLEDRHRQPTLDGFSAASTVTVKGATTHAH